MEANRGLKKRYDSIFRNILDKIKLKSFDISKNGICQRNIKEIKKLVELVEEVKNINNSFSCSEYWKR